MPQKSDSTTHRSRKGTGRCESYLLYHPLLSPRSKLVYAFLSVFANNKTDRLVGVSHLQIASTMGWDERWIKKLLLELLEAGAISIEEQWVRQGDKKYITGHSYCVKREAVRHMHPMKEQFHKVAIHPDQPPPPPRPIPTHSQFGYVETDLLLNSDLCWQAKLLYVWHAVHSGRDDDFNFTSMITMAKALRISRGRYTDYLKQLVDLGAMSYISASDIPAKAVGGRKRRTNNYYLLRPNKPPKPHPISAPIPPTPGSIPPTPGSIPPDDREHNHSILSEYRTESITEKGNIVFPDVKVNVTQCPPLPMVDYLADHVESEAIENRNRMLQIADYLKLDISELQQQLNPPHPPPPHEK